MSDANESNLVQRREDRRTLEKMRRKLATSGTVGKKSEPARPIQSGKRGMRIWPFAIGAAGLLIALNLGLSQQETILKAIGIESEPKNRLAPPAGLSMDDQARFWALAAYDVPKLRKSFTVPKGVPIEIKYARTQLENLLAENLGQEVRNEIALLQRKAPASKPRPKTAKSRKANGR